MYQQDEEPFAPDYQDDYLKPLVTAWLGRINQAEEARTPWKKLGDECMHFYEATANFLWDASSQHKFWEGVTQPTFRVVIAKAFELVAQIGPTLFFRAPRRKVSPRRANALPPEMFGDIQNDPQAQAVYQQYQTEMSAEMQADVSRATMLETWLNYTPDQMPGGGLEEHVERAIVEALIRGRGVLWPQPYQVPGSDRTLTGLFYDTVENLYIDPDAERLEDARWFARRRIENYRKVEDRFGLPRNSLRGKTTLDSLWAASATAQAKPNDVKAKDLIVYYEIYSKNGPGCDCTGLDWRISEHLQEVVGEYAYLAICPSCDYPLNMPADMLTSGANDEQVRDAMQWPIPFWAGNHLPFVPLDFYPSTRSVWPMPPLAPGIGELKFLNVMISHLCNRIWMSSRDFIAVAKSAQKEVERIIREGQDLSILPVSDHHEDISKMIKFLDQPNINVDAWHIIDRVAQMFDKRTGLTDLVYGLTAAQSRSAEDAATKRQAISARPDHMARKVEKWMARASSMEAFCTRWFVEAKDVAPLIGNTAANLWSWLIDSQDVDLVVREMEYTVVAGSGRRRNHELELSNLNQALQFFFPEMSKHADITTDVSALNSLIQRWGDAAQIDLSDVVLQPRMPPAPEGPNPAEIEMQMRQEEHQVNMASRQTDLQMKQIEAQMRMQMEQQKAELEAQKLAQQAMADQSKVAIQASQAQNEMQVKEQQAALDMLYGEAMHEQKLVQEQQSHEQRLQQAARKADLDLFTTAAKTTSDINSARRRANMKPTSTPTRKKSKAVPAS
jgi:hypothetical protein